MVAPPAQSEFSPTQTLRLALGPLELQGLLLPMPQIMAPVSNTRCMDRPVASACASEHELLVPVAYRPVLMNALLIHVLRKRRSVLIGPVEMAMLSLISVQLSPEVVSLNVIGALLLASQALSLSGGARKLT